MQRLLWLLLVLVVGAPGCQTQATGKQLSRVAKDWCLTVRASQVVPVYPLTQDIQPGDVFLVQSTVEDEVKVFEDQGFLPMPVQIARLGMAGAADFYDGQQVPPKFWEKYKEDQWTPAPLAAFPSYTFKVQRGGGVNVALPIEGVPVAFGLLAGDSATGSVTISDASTYGIDFASAWDALEHWISEHPDKLELVGQTPAEGQPSPVLLRVVTRVYNVGQVKVSLNNDESIGANIKAGVAPGSSVPDITPGDAVANFKSMKDAMKVDPGKPDLGKVPLPGGSASFTAVTARSVSMDQTFKRPLVIGYIGFDVPVFDKGELGEPVLTVNRLNIGKPEGAPVTVHTGPFRNSTLNELNSVLGTIENRADAEAVLGDAAKRAGCADAYKPTAELPPRAAFTHATLSRKVPTMKCLEAARGALKDAMKKDQEKAAADTKKTASTNAPTDAVQ